MSEHESLSLFERFVESSGEGMGWADLEGRIRYANPALVEMIAGEVDEILGSSVIELYGAEDQKRLREEIFPFVLQEGSWEGELELNSLTGRRIPTLNRLVALHDDTGNPACFGNIVSDLTRQKDAEQQLHQHQERLEETVAERTRHLAESEARYRTLFEHSPEAIAVLDADTGLFADVNENAEKLYGKTRAELLKLGPWDVSPPRQADGRTSGEAARAYVGEAMAGGTPVFEWIHLNLETENEVPCEIRLVRLPSSERPLVRGSIIDISERKEVERLSRTQRDLALSMSVAQSLSETLASCLDAAIRIADMDAGGIYLMDEVNGDLELVHSSGLSDAFVENGRHYDADDQHTRAVMVGEPIYIDVDHIDDLLNEEQRKEGLRTLAVLPVSYEGRVIASVNVASSRHDRIVLPIRTALEVVISQIGSTISHARAEERLRSSEERYRNFVINASEGIYRVDFPEPISIDLPRDELEARIGRSALVGEANEALAKMYGIMPADMVGRPATEFAPNYGARGVKVVYAPNHQVMDEETLDVDAEGNTIYLLESFNGIVEAGQLTRIWGVQRNITDRKKAEEERQKLEEQLLQAQKMEAVGRLAGGVAHDFNNIMTGINGYAEMVLESVDPGDPLRADIEEIRKAGERAAALTNQLLAFSRKQVIAPRVINPNEAIERSQKMLQRIIGEDIDLVFSPARSLGRIKADPAQIDQVLVNLAVNARDAMPTGGRLSVETKNVLLGEAQTKAHEDCRPGEFVRMEVGDNGCGMDEETCARIFEPFFTTKGKEHGTGLGLATVYGIVKQNGGFIDVDSEPNVGTTFRIYFPRVFEDAARIAARQHPVLPQGAETILLVEDEDMVRSLAQRVLERHGYEVVEARDGGNAYLACSNYRGKIDLLLTDVVMPGMNGRELYRKLMELKPDLKVLFMSGYTENVIAHHGVLEKGMEFIQKPFTISDLVRKVRRVLER